MGYRIENKGMNSIFDKLSETYYLYAPKKIKGGGAFSDTDSIKYGQISKVEEIVFDKKSNYSFKEVLLPLSQTLFFYTEDQVKEADGPKKGAIIFLRSCDLHAVKRLDEIYLKNGFEDYYYKQLRENVKFVLMGCQETFENCFCVDMGTNRCDTYDFSIEQTESNIVEVDNRTAEFDELFASYGLQQEVTPSFVRSNKVHVTIPEGLSIDVSKSKMWDEYDNRCIGCGRCNFVCPTCTCFTMQDIFYTDNGKVGERRRVLASCMVDGFTEVAGGGEYRKKKGQRMRFRVLHKVYDYKAKFGYTMCTGCGRCDDVCPEYISFSNCINKLESAVKEVNEIE
jgi:anaerobic sulfite reductase subunit A